MNSESRLTKVTANGDKLKRRSHGCTGGMALGLTASKGNIVVESCDWFTPPGPDFVGSLGVESVQGEGNKYLHMGWDGYINEKGVCLTGFGRNANSIPYPNEPAPRITEDKLMKQSNSARELVKLWTESLHKYGNGYGLAHLIIDAKEGYLVESADIAYDTDENFAIHGPMTDQVYACANFYVSERLSKYQSGIGAGYSRASRVWELLVEHQYDSITVRPTSGITLPRMMSIYRNHGNLTPDEARMSVYTPELDNPDAVCTHGIYYMTHCVYLLNPEVGNTGLLSCGWMTFSQPCLSPFIPFYVGITKVPDDFSTTTAAKIFDDLRLTLEYHPEMRDKITRYWTVWELQAIEQMYPLENQVKSLVADGKVTVARELLTAFIQSKCDDALAKAKVWIDDLKALPVT